MSGQEHGRRGWLVGLLLCGAAMTTHAAGVDPLTAKIDARDAERFAALLATTPAPTAEQIQRGYLDGAGRGVEIFTPGRITDAAKMARVVGADPKPYEYAIRECLPLLPALNADLTAIYLAYAGLLPERPLPAIYVVFGARNSGGTAAPDAQVIGLEVMCGLGTTPAAFRKGMRSIFAHETVHTWQSSEDEGGGPDPLLTWALREGVPDYLSMLVTGEMPDPDRDRWASARQSELWIEFQHDRAGMAALPEAAAKGAAGRAYSRRWFANYGSPPEGWPGEAGYWIGMRIAQDYVAHSADKHQAIRDLLELKDPARILAISGFGQ